MTDTGKYATKTYTASASQTTFLITFTYKQKKFVRVTKDGSDQVRGTDWDFDATGLNVVFATPLAGGETVLIRRFSDRTPINTFQDGSSIPADQLNDVLQQGLHFSEEVADGHQ